MSENARLNGCLNDIDLEFVEREATPRLLMKLGIQLHLAGLSLSNTVAILEIFGVERARSTVHNWIHKAERQSDGGRSPDHIAVDETVIQLNDEQYWLYAVARSRWLLAGRQELRSCHRHQNARVLVGKRDTLCLVNAVDPETNESPHTTLEPTTTKVLAHSFRTELVEKHEVDAAVFLVDGSHSLQDACHRHGFDFRDEQHGQRNSVKRVFCEVKRRTSSFSNCFSNANAKTANKWLRSFAFAWNQLI